MLDRFGNYDYEMVLRLLLLGIIFTVVNTISLSYIGTNRETVIVRIKPGSNTEQIAQVLERKKVIQNQLFFKILAKAERLDGKLKAGSYGFLPAMTVDQVIKQLVEGKGLHCTITIPEGFTLEQIAQLLAKKELVDKGTFLRVAKENKFPYPFLKEAQAGKQSVEGYLFPDTYQIEIGSSEKQIINMMLKAFAGQAAARWQKAAQKEGLSLHQLVTLASIVEREAKIDKERPIISAVFYNRLKKKMKLQSCATVQYVLKQPKEHLSLKDIAVKSPYNTYLHQGLPPGPIGNPGLASLEASLHPAKSDYLFFVARGDGGHYFSRDFNQHLAAAAKTQKSKEKKNQ